MYSANSETLSCAVQKTCTVLANGGVNCPHCSKFVGSILLYEFTLHLVC